MSATLLIIGYTICILIAGIAIGATLLRDLLDGLWSWPKRTKPVRTEPLPTAWALHLADLNRPAVYRRKQQRIIDVEAG